MLEFSLPMCQIMRARVCLSASSIIFYVIDQSERERERDTLHLAVDDGTNTLNNLWRAKKKRSAGELQYICIYKYETDATERPRPRFWRWRCLRLKHHDCQVLPLGHPISRWKCRHHWSCQWLQGTTDHHPDTRHLPHPWEANKASMDKHSLNKQYSEHLLISPLRKALIKICNMPLSQLVRHR